ncbi:MAG: hypothetical protein KF729_15710 [Sandaracinaceae bacterium]|nr:hypothetical protein [Sandaracinaceae bacterium]
MTRSLGVLSLSLLLVIPSAVLADAVGPIDPAVTCPRGARVEVNHCGTVCVPRRCAATSECQPGETCAAVSVCVADEPYCGGWSMAPYERAHGACDASGGCSTGECRAFSGCVAATPGTDAGSAASDAGGARDGGSGAVVTYGCGCRAASGGAGGGLATIGLALALVCGRRRAGASFIGRGAARGSAPPRSAPR